MYDKELAVIVADFFDGIGEDEWYYYLEDASPIVWMEEQKWLREESTLWKR